MIKDNKSALNNFLQGLIEGYNYYFNPASMIKKNDDMMTPNYSPMKAPTINNTPPVGQSASVEPLPFFKYQPPVGQDTINFNPRNPDPRITIDEAPPVQKYNYPDINLNDIDTISLASALKFLQTQGYREY